MPKLRWVLFLLAVATALAAWRVWYLSEQVTAASLAASAARRIEAPAPDFDAILRELDLGLDLATAEGDAASGDEILLQRAGVHQRRQSYALALADAEALLERSALRPAEVLHLASRAARGAGELEQALSLARELEAADPEFPGAHDLVGAIEMQIVDERLEAVRRILDASLSSTRARAGMELARRASALPPDAAPRRRALDSLATVLSLPREREEIRALVAEASEHLVAARAAYVAGLAAQAGPASIEGFLVVLARAGRDEEAAELGRIALRRRPPPAYSGVLVRAALALDRVERPGAAAALVRSCLQRTPALAAGYGALEPRLLLDWCLFLRGRGLWPELVRAADMLERRRDQYRGILDLGTAPQLLVGLARSRMGDAEGALAALLRVRPVGRRAEVFPGEQFVSQLARADAFRTFEQRNREEDALQEIRHHPAPPRDGGPTATAYGEILLRLGRQRRAESNWEAAVHLLARALCHLSSRRAELEPEWRRAGAELLRYQRTTIEAIAARLAENGRALPVSDVDVHRLCLLGEFHLARGNFAAAHTAALRALADYEGFPPALELDAAALRGLHRETECIERLLALAEGGAAGPTTWAELRALPAAKFTPEARLRWYRVDPRGAALRDVARRLAADGDLELALAALRPQTAGELAASDRLLAARLLADLERWPDCRKTLEQIPVEDPAFAGAAGLVLEAAVHPRGPEEEGDPLARALARVYRAPALEAAGFDRAADALFATDHREEARLLLSHLDLDLGQHAPALLLRRGIAELAAGRLSAGLEALDRAEAYLPGGETRLGPVLMALEGGDAEGLRGAAQALLASGFATNERREALVQALAGEYGVAVRLARRAEADAGGRDPRTLLARAAIELLSPAEEGGEAGPSPAAEAAATFGGVVDPRQTLGILLALESAPWSAWALARLRELPPLAAATPWPLLLEAIALVALGADAEAEAVLAALSGPVENLRFAWDLRQEFLRTRPGVTADSPAWHEFRRERAKALGPEGLGTVELRFLWGEELVAQGRAGEAVEVLAAGLARVPGDPTLGIALARARATAGDLLGAARGYDELFATLEDRAIDDLVPEYLALLRQAAAAGALHAGAWWARLEALETQRPREPAVVRELARRIVETADERRDQGIARAQERMERLRERTGRVPIETLRRGEAARWVEFLAGLDAQAALELADAELLADPAAIDLWRARSTALAAAGRREEAAAELSTLLLMVADPAAQLQQAGLFAGLDRGPALVLPTLQRLERRGEVERPAELVLVRSRALLAGTARERDQGLALLGAAWDASDPAVGAPLRTAIGRTLAEALLLRGAAGDDELAAAILADLVPAASDPLERDYFQALLNLAGG
ncbi:MAG: hypothetical protein AB1726_18405 [Planctomycetota bacterium]